MKTLKLYHGKQLLAKIGYERRSDMMLSVERAKPLLLTLGLLMNTQKQRKHEKQTQVNK